jgi:type IV secretory pathway VirB10-like protein
LEAVSQLANFREWKFKRPDIDVGFECKENSAMMHHNLAVLTLASLAFGTAATAQQASPQPAQPDQYQGVSQPPNDPITASPDAPPPPAKPAAGVVYAPAPTQPQPSQAAPDTNYSQQTNYPQANDPQDGSQQAMAARPRPYDPDGDIVHPLPARPGELMEGATIRVRLTERISSTETEKGEPFHGQVASDVLQDGKVLIPAGSGIEGRVSAVSAGHFGGHGSFRLQPEVVILPDGSRFRLHAETTGTPGSKTRVGSEGTINPGSRATKDGIEYGAAVGTGAVAGAVIGGPVGALTGSLIGAGVITTHLLVDHPQAALEPGSILLFTLTQPMDLMPATN